MRRVAAPPAVAAEPTLGVAPVLLLDGVSKRYGRVTAVRELDLAVETGEVLAVVGPSGCGKSTTLRLIAGLEPPDAGHIRLGGRDVAGPRAWVPAEHRRVGLVFQDYALFPHLRVVGNVAFGLDRWPAGARRERVAEVLDLVALGDLAERYPHELSGGEQQRVALARAIAPEPTVVLLDEPFSNLDRNLRARVRAETLAVLRRTGTTAILVTHDQDEAMAAGDRVMVMNAGRREQLDVPQRVFHHPANRFVAAFMGDADFLPVRQEAGELLSELGRVVSGDRPVPPGRIDVMVRPHEVALHADPGGSARVVGVVCQGAFNLYTARLASGRTVRSLQPHTVAFAEGDAVRAELAAGARPTVLPGS